jgi:hypothetical protein
MWVCLCVGGGAGDQRTTVRKRGDSTCRARDLLKLVVATNRALAHIVSLIVSDLRHMKAPKMCDTHHTTCPDRIANICMRRSSCDM